MDRTVAFLAAGWARRRSGWRRMSPGSSGTGCSTRCGARRIALVADGVCGRGTRSTWVVRNTIGLRLAEMGPIENADYVGLDLTLAIHEAVLGALNSDPDPHRCCGRLVTAGSSARGRPRIPGLAGGRARGRRAAVERSR